MCPLDIFGKLEPTIDLLAQSEGIIIELVRMRLILSMKEEKYLFVES